ncbi:MAG: cell division protein ZapA [Calditrichae bacterium]|nr:cell division protein ZapA [Calditrichota bacterium]MCB9057235.1 cell division protein ZapA [Calditrichia bacterium]
MAPGQINVNIFGSQYTLVSEDDDNFVKSIALYLDEKMREIDRSQNMKSTARLAILAALNITEELFDEREYRKKLLNQINEEARKMNHSITELLEE